MISFSLFYFILIISVYYVQLLILMNYLSMQMCAFEVTRYWYPLVRGGWRERDSPDLSIGAVKREFLPWTRLQPPRKTKRFVPIKLIFLL